MRRLLTASVLVGSICFLDSGFAWVHSSIQAPAVAKSRLVPSRARYMVVESLSLESISDNHEEVGQELADSLQRMLDAEWMPQEVHGRIAASVKASYVRCRSAGEADLMSIMTETADDLIAKWNEYDQDAFVNAWDISNYVSDYLAAKTGGQGCECTQKLY